MPNPLEKQPNNDAQLESFNVISRWEFEIGGKHYDIRKVVEWARNLPVEEIPTAALEDMKKGEYWYDTNRQRIKLQEIFDLYKQAIGKGWWAGPIYSFTPVGTPLLRRVKESLL